MKSMAKYPAAFINVLAEEGTHSDTLDALQDVWDELQNLRTALIKSGCTFTEVNAMQKTGHSYAKTKKFH